MEIPQVIAGTLVREEIGRFVRESPGNRYPGDRKPYFEQPLVGFAAVNDPIFLRYKTIIGDFHLTPGEFFEKTFRRKLSGGTVICWVLPISRHARESNRGERRWPSRDWARTRTHGEAFNNQLREHLVAFLCGKGHKTMAPTLSREWKRIDSISRGIASSWSERHAAFAAGLGTFGLSDGLITEKGIAHRCGSVISDIVLAPSPVPYPSHTANCLFYRDGSCGRCIGRCPAGAITTRGHDKGGCRQYVHGTIPSEAGERYGVKVLGCGLCQTKVPCEHGIPEISSVTLNNRQQNHTIK